MFIEVIGGLFDTLFFLEIYSWPRERGMNPRGERQGGTGGNGAIHGSGNIIQTKTSGKNNF